MKPSIPWLRVFVEGVVIVGSILLALGCGEDDPMAPELGPDELCANQAGDAAATFGDPSLDAAVRAALGLTPQDQVLCSSLLSLTTLRADSAGIVSLAGMQNLSRLDVLWLRANSISDLGPLRGLTELTELRLGFNPAPDISPLNDLVQLTWLGVGATTLSDISALSGLSNLAFVNLGSNSIVDISPLTGLTQLSSVRLINNPDLANIQPLILNTGLGPGDAVNLQVTAVSCGDVALLEAKGVAVVSDCP